MRLWFPRPYELTTHGGQTVDWLTKCALLDLEMLLGYELTIDQGSYNHGAVAVSAGTHNGGGAVDLAPYDAARKVELARSVGFAAWHRRAIPGVWEEHIHMIQMSNERTSPAASAQKVAYMDGRDGLADDGLDNGPRQYIHRRYVWPGGRAAKAKVRRNKKRFHPSKPVAKREPAHVAPKPAPHKLPTKAAGKSEAATHIEGKTMTEQNIETPAAPVVETPAPAPAPAGATSDAGAAPEPPTYVPPAEESAPAEQPSTDLTAPVPAEPVEQGQTMVLGQAPTPPPAAPASGATSDAGAVPEPPAYVAPAEEPAPAAPAPAAVLPDPTEVLPADHKPVELQEPAAPKVFEQHIIDAIEEIVEKKIGELATSLVQQVVEKVKASEIQKLETFLEALR